MKFYFAPLEGITGFIIRNAYAHQFEGCDRYFTPFIPSGHAWNRKIERDLSPENNKDVVLIPQAISNDVDDLLELEQQLMEFGYWEYNLNLGCPSGTVVPKKRGAGFLSVPDELEAFLDDLFSRSQMQISIKTRLGMDDVEEWERLVSIYKKYPMTELIIHPRLRKDFYKGSPRIACYEYAYQELKDNTSLCYNGDIVSLSSYNNVVTAFPETDAIMIGRGLLMYPGLIHFLSTGALPEDYKDRLYAMHQEIVLGYTQIFSGEKDVLMHMKQFWSYFAYSFLDSEKLCKKILKSKKMSEYEVYVAELFREHELDLSFT